METTRIDSAVKIVSLQGQAFIIGQDGTVEPVTVGQVLLPGTLLLTDANTNIVYGEAPTAESPPQPPVDETALVDADAIQAAILAGLDPTELFSATAAGNEAPVAATGDGSSGNAGFVVVDRVGDAVISQAGFDTRFAPEAFASQLRVLPERDIAADENSIPIITVVIDPPPTPPSDGGGGDGGGSGGGATLAYVEESALPNGTNPDSNNESASGHFDIDTGGDVLATLEIRLANGDWVDVTGGGQIVGQYGTLDVILVDGVYQWTYTLNGAADHPDDMNIGAEDVLQENFEVRATDDDGDQATAGLTIDVRDDGPVAQDDDYSVTESGLPCYNLMLVSDTSGSMQGDKLALAKAALINLINSYEGIASELRISVIDFGNGVKGQQVDMTPAEAITYINTLTAGGFTNYAAPLNEAEVTLTDQLDDKPGEIHKVYFISDGEPNRGDTPDGWQGFADGNDIDVIAVGVGVEGANAEAELDKVGNSGDETLLIDDATELDAALQDTVPAPTQVTGNVLTNDMGGTDAGGADGLGRVVSVTYGENTYEVPENGSVDIPTDNDGILTMHSNGDFTYSGPADVDEGGLTESFTYTMTDGDGDTSSATLNITVEDNGQTPPPDGGGDNGGGSHPDCPPISYWIDHISLPHVAASFAGLWGHALAAADLLIDMNDTESGINVFLKNGPDGVVLTREDRFDGDDYLGERLSAFIGDEPGHTGDPLFFTLDMNIDGSYQFDLHNLDPVRPDAFLAEQTLEFEFITRDCHGEEITHPFSIDIDSAAQHLVGSALADAIQAEVGDKLHILGLEGDDTLMGGVNIDVLEGGDGHDELNGLLGNNILSGGSGVDTFIFTEVDPHSVNVITDYTEGEALDLSALLSELDASELSDCLSFSLDNGDTLLQVSPNGGDSQHIRLENVDLLDMYGAASSAELVNAMLTEQTLVIDS
ncbi:hypothetical protein GCM10022421_04700 [Oceanisphaera sediminis]|uniref:VWFA domain-containing protein n=1 Tax=Oceanisphaera sediminis TaxID=981381 RepID=A0ABP7D9K9_9GAMM